MTLLLRLIIPILLLAGGVVSGSARGEDRVTWTPEGSDKPVVVVGDVLDSTGRRVVIKPLSGTTMTLQADAVRSIETTYCAPHLRGVEEFRRGETAAARASLTEALKAEPREWVDREILAWLVKCHQRDNQLSAALAAFREIVRTDEQSRHWGIAPLIWTPAAISEEIRVDARRWLSSHIPSDQLLGASLLLTDPAFASQAEERLEALARNPNPSLATLGKTQLWRLQLANRNLTEISLKNWKDDIARMPRELRAGPQLLLARAWERRGESRRAAAEALWIPTVYPDNEQLAARALSSAAEGLHRAGLPEESAALVEELKLHYPWSRDAAQARSW